MLYNCMEKPAVICNHPWFYPYVNINHIYFLAHCLVIDVILVSITEVGTRANLIIENYSNCFLYLAEISALNFKAEILELYKYSSINVFVCPIIFPIQCTPVWYLSPVISTVIRFLILVTPFVRCVFVNTISY